MAPDLQSHVFLDMLQPVLWMVQYPPQQLPHVFCVFSMHWRQLVLHSQQDRKMRHCEHLVSQARNTETDVRVVISRKRSPCGDLRASGRHGIEALRTISSVSSGWHGD